MGPGLFYSWEMDRPVYIFLFLKEKKNSHRIDPILLAGTAELPHFLLQKMLLTPPTAFPNASPQPRGLEKIKYENA